MNEDVLKTFIVAVARHLGETGADTMKIKSLLGTDISIELTVKASFATDEDKAKAKLNKEEPDPLEVN